MTFITPASPFDETARRLPGALALAVGDRELTYAELDARANRLARVLVNHGVGPEVVTGILLERGIEQVIAVLGVLKAGGAYLPLDPSYPDQRLAYMVSDTAPPLILTTEKLAGRLAVHGTDLLDIEAPGRASDAAAGTLPAARVSADHLAYVMYTSGSTGAPKAVGVTRRGLQVIAAATRSVIGLRMTDRVLHAASSSFDACVGDMLLAFGSGASLHVPPLDDGVPVELAEFISQARITALVLPPSALAGLVGDAPLRLVHTLVLAGENCPPALAARWSAPGRRIFNCYGATEATIWSTRHRLTDRDTESVPIGRPVPGVAVHILDADAQSIPVGQAGELCVGGPVLARGYLGQPALTASRFIPDPFSAVPGRRLYRTGDVARWKPGGVIEYLGRIDDQVKVHGIRIELGDIENVLGQHPGVRQAAAVVHERAPGRAEILGFVVPRADPGPHEAELRQHCADRLPRSMVPSRVITLAQIPVSGSGKLNRQALRKLGAARGGPGPGPEPRTASEIFVAGVWGELMGLGAVSRDCDFLAVGGNSLLASQIVARIRKHFEIRVPLRTVFERPGLAEFAAEVDQLLAAKEFSAVSPGPVRRVRSLRTRGT
jgi:amino acid adenylation domain-containing protein